MSNNLTKYRIEWLSWNSAHPGAVFLGHVFATCPEQARNEARRQWPAGNGQHYEATPTR